jgi:hypothetical protein
VSAEVPRPGGGAPQRWAWNLRRTATSGWRAALAAGVAVAVELAAAAVLTSRELAERLPGLPLRWVALVLVGLAAASLATAALHVLFARIWDRLAAAPGRTEAEQAGFALRALWIWLGAGAAALALGLATAFALSPQWWAAGEQPAVAEPAPNEPLGRLRPVEGREEVWKTPGPTPALAAPGEILPDREVTSSTMPKPPFGRYMVLEDVPRVCDVDEPEAFCLLNHGGNAVPGLSGNAVAGVGANGESGVGPVFRRIGLEVEAKVLGPPAYPRPRLSLRSGDWGIEIAPAEGEVLKPGLYERVSAWDKDLALPYLSVRVPGETCPGSTTERFRIHDIELDVDGRPRRLVVDFQKLCFGWTVGRFQLGRS